VLADWVDAVAAPVDAVAAVVVAPAPAVAAFVVAPAPVVAVAAVAAVAVLGCKPITCSSDCSSVPNRFCTVPAGACAVVLLLESSADPTCEPFLWPCVWILSVGSADAADVKFEIDDI
jgi:hypothetical protein